MNSSISNDFEQQSVVRNLDFLLRTEELQVVLIASDYAKEPLTETVLYLAKQLQAIYQRRFLVLDFGDLYKNSDSSYQNINELEVIKDNAETNISKLKIYIEECRKHYDQVFIIPHIKLNREETTLPSLDYDGAILLRTKKSSNPTSKKVITNKILDAQVKIKAILDIGV